MRLTLHVTSFTVKDDGSHIERIVEQSSTTLPLNLKTPTRYNIYLSQLTTQTHSKKLWRRDFLKRQNNALIEVATECTNEHHEVLKPLTHNGRHWWHQINVQTHTMMSEPNPIPVLLTKPDTRHLEGKQALNHTSKSTNSLISPNLLE